MPRRPAGRQLRRIAAGTCLLAAGIVAIALTWPWTTKAAPKPAAGTSFTDHNGVIVFEQQPSGKLGIARPDGTEPRLFGQLGALQGYDLPVASADGRYLVTNEGQVVTLAAGRPTSIAYTAMTAQLQGNSSNWVVASFADGGKFVAAAECASAAGSTWEVRLTPASASGTGSLLGPVDGAWDGQGVAGDPRSEGAFVVRGGGGECESQQAPSPHGDTGVVLVRPGQAPQTVVTAAAMRQAFGVAPSTPVLLDVYPRPDGSMLAVTASTISVAQGSENVTETSLGVVVVTRAGRIAAKLARPVGSPLSWSRAGATIATVLYPASANRTGAQVLIWPVGGPVRTIKLTTRRDESIDQLLWSPDGTQLACSFQQYQAALTEVQSIVKGWTLIDLSTKHVHQVTAPGQPAAWLPGQGGAR